jgi:hypothetical protein
MSDATPPPDDIAGLRAQAVCSHCNGTGTVAINASTGRYVAPGPVPDDARGVAEAPCWECLVYPGGFDGPTGAD